MRLALRIGGDCSVREKVRVALYQGQLMSDRGIEPAMEAITSVDGAVLALLGYGPWTERLRDEAAFDTEEALVAQIAHDVEATRAATRPV